MVRLLFKHSNSKLRSMFWGSPFIPVGTNQMECCFSRFLLASRQMLNKFAPFLESNDVWMWKFCVNLVDRLPICFWHPSWGKFPGLGNSPECTRHLELSNHLEDFISNRLYFPGPSPDESLEIYMHTSCQPLWRKIWSVKKNEILQKVMRWSLFKQDAVFSERSSLVWNLRGSILPDKPTYRGQKCQRQFHQGSKRH